MRAGSRFRAAPTAAPRAAATAAHGKNADGMTAELEEETQDGVVPESGIDPRNAHVSPSTPGESRDGAETAAATA